MSQDINLSLSGRSSKSKKSILSLTIWGFFLIVFAVSAVSMLYSLYLNSQLASLKEEETEVRNSISGFATQKVRYLTIDERLSSISKILSTRKMISARASSVLDLIPAGFRVETFSSDDKNVVIEIASTNLSDFDTLLEQQIPDYTKGNTLGLKRIDISNFSESSDGYEAGLNFEFTPEK